MGKRQLYLILVVKERGVSRCGEVHVNPAGFQSGPLFFPTWANLIGRVFVITLEASVGDVISVYRTSRRFKGASDTHP